MNVATLLEEALKLPLEEREELCDKLQHSLQQLVESGPEQAWLDRANGKLRLVVFHKMGPSFDLPEHYGAKLAYQWKKREL